MVRRSRCAKEKIMSSEVLLRRDVHRAITDAIAAAIEAGAGEYKMPWHGGLKRPVNAYTKKAYHGGNVIALWNAASHSHFRSSLWATYRQWAVLGAQVRKGERGSVVVFYKTISSSPEGEECKTVQKTTQPRMVARASWVFNLEQTDGWTPPEQAAPSAVEVREQVEAYIAGTRAEIRHGGDIAYYDRVGDFIAVPRPEEFVATETSSATEGYYSVVLHELTHWSGAPNRLNRNLRGRFGDHAYALEELIAEFGAAFLCADLEIANEPRLDHAAYVKSWLRVLMEDATALFTAANKASVAVTYLDDIGGRRQ
jgi:antirestriction protein ArdC